MRLFAILLGQGQTLKLRIMGTTDLHMNLLSYDYFTDDSGTRQALKIGVIGFVPPQIMQWDQLHVQGRAACATSPRPRACRCHA
jgi:2',3'-cyclic-nucleotide 2'-phosphodiesterase (5'-nucleotidase family)